MVPHEVDRVDPNLLGQGKIPPIQRMDTTMSITSPEQIADLVEKAERYLKFSPHAESHGLIRELTTELALMYSLYLMVHQEFAWKKEEYQRIREIIAEDLPTSHLTHRLYVLVYDPDQLETLLRDGL
jgi:hypothetical protein